MKKITVLVGNIASGKSSYLVKYPLGVVISKDNLRKKFSGSIGKSYIYDPFVEASIADLCASQLDIYIYLGVEHIIIDETHMSLDSRKWIFNTLGIGDYEVEAIVFPDDGEDIHVQRRMKDNHGTKEDGCTEEIWREVYRRKEDKFQYPTIDEGFDEIIEL